MADERLRIVIDALNKASDDLQKVKRDLGDVDDASKKAGTSTKSFGDTWTTAMLGINMTLQVAKAAGEALKKVYEAAKEGAELEYAKTRFDNLATSIGAVSGALMDDLREATDGMVSDAELVASAADFMGLGLAKSHDEVVRLTTVAGALGMNMNQLVLTLTNQTTMRFDALGVSVDGFDEKVEALKQTGMDANEAFTEAFLQQAEEQIEKVGSVADTTAGDFMRLEASAENLGNTLKLYLVETLVGSIPAINEFFETLNIGLEGRRIGEHADEMAEKLMALGYSAKELKEMTGQQNFYFFEDEAYYEDAKRSVEIYQDLLDAQHEAADAAAETAAAYYPYITAVNDSTEAIKNQADAAADTAASYYDYVTTIDDGRETQILANDAIMTANKAMQSYTDTLLFNIASQGLTDKAALELAYAMGLVDESTIYAYEQTDRFRKLLDDGLITWEQYMNLVSGTADEIDRLESKDIDINIEWHEKGAPSATATAFIGGGTITVGDRIVTSEATGGPVSAGNPYLWQEYGYRGEMLVPSQNGYVLSRADAKRIVSEAVNSKGGGNTYNYNLTMPTSMNPADVAMAFELLQAYGG